MSPQRQRIEAALHAALAEPALAAAAAQCRARIEWRSVPTQAGALPLPLLLWSGAQDGPQIALCADETVLAELLMPLPPPGRQSLGALRRQCAGFTLQGSELAVAQTLPFIERLLEALRSQFNAMPTAASADHAGLAFITGGYLPLGRTGDWAYAERAGLDGGPPLLMLHTAGADARQWHGLMAFSALRETWSLHAFDLPGHGRSPLPTGTPPAGWRLTEAAYLDWVIGYLDAAGLERVVLLGCSMGSAIGLALLARHPHRFAGALLLETPYRSPGRRSPYLDHPEVHGARLASAWVGSLLSPSSPKAGRDQATWIYSQGAPGVYDGDLAFYSDDFDAHQHTPHIDTQRTPLWLLTGDYDYSATPADSRRVAEEIAGARFAELAGFGHFPMVEHPAALLPHLQPALQALRAALLA